MGRPRTTLGHGAQNRRADMRTQQLCVDQGCGRGDERLDLDHKGAPEPSSSQMRVLNTRYVERRVLGVREDLRVDAVMR
jgi:hypothetical protein